MENFYKLLGQDYNGYNKQTLLGSLLTPPEVNNQEIDYNPFEMLSLDELQPAPVEFNDFNLPSVESQTYEKPVATKNIANFIQEQLGAKQPQPQTKAQEILTNRFSNEPQPNSYNNFNSEPEPTLNDFISAIRQTAQGKIVGGQDVANQRYATRLKGISSLGTLKGGATGALVDRAMTDPAFREQLYALQTGFRQGTQLTPEGTIQEIPGYIPFRQELKGGEETGKQKVQLQYEPEIQGRKKAAELEQERQNKSIEKQIKSSDVLSLVNQAMPLLDKATGSYIGAARALGKKAAGISDEETQANSALEVIGGRLVAAMPRMEGPQSNYDVQLYIEMAGKVADKTTPPEDRKAALRTLVELSQKYPSGGKINSLELGIPQGYTPTNRTSGGKPVYQDQQGNLIVID